MRFLTIDPSLVCSGLVVIRINSEGHVFETMTEVKTSAKWNRPDRVFFIFKQVGDFIAANPKIRSAVIEDYAFSNIGDVNSITPLAEVVGAMICACLSKGVRIHRVSSTTWKSVIGWKGMKKTTVAQKGEYLDRVFNLFGVRCESCDIADAVMIGIALSRILRRDGKLSEGAVRLGDGIRNE